MQDEPLTPHEQADFDRLPREMTPPAALEDRVVAALARTGSIRSHRPAWLLPVAAGFLLLMAGFGAGRLVPTIGSVPPTERYLLLLYGADAASASEEQVRVAEYRAWASVQQQAGRLLVAEKLSDEARVFGPGASAPASGRGPAGFFLIRASTPEEAAAVAASCPHLSYGGTVVVRRVD